MEIQTKERLIKVPESKYREMKRMKKRQRTAKRLAMEMWQLFSNVK